MATEIEKKYLLRENGQEYHTHALLEHFASIDSLVDEVETKGQVVKQGYLSLEEGIELANTLGIKVDFDPKEARLRNKVGICYLTIKGEGNLQRRELEAKINSKIFQDYWAATDGRRVEKIRLTKPAGQYDLEVDLYTDRDLIVLEVEFPSTEEANSFAALGLDLTANKDYKNKNLAR